MRASLHLVTLSSSTITFNITTYFKTDLLQRAMPHFGFVIRSAQARSVRDAQSTQWMLATERPRVVATYTGSCLDASSTTFIAYVPSGKRSGGYRRNAGIAVISVALARFTGHATRFADHMPDYASAMLVGSVHPFEPGELFTSIIMDPCRFPSDPRGNLQPEKAGSLMAACCRGARA